MVKTRLSKAPATLVFILYAACVWAAGPNTNLNWTDNFESYPDQTPLRHGTNGWYASSTNVKVQTSVYATGSRAAAIPMDTSLTNRFTDISISNVWINMRIKPVLAKSEYPVMLNTNSSSITFITSNGYFASWGGSVSNWTIHANTLLGQPVPAIDESEWITVHMCQNYTTKRWSLFVNNLFLGDNLPFVNQNSSSFRGFDFYTGIHTTFADEVWITTNFPADLEEDGGDWLPDLILHPEPPTLRASTFQGEICTTNYTLRKTVGLPLAFYHTTPTGWENRVQFIPDPGLTTGEFNTVRLSFNTTNIDARGAPYYTNFFVHGVDSRFGRPAKESPQEIRVELSVALHAATTLNVTRGSYPDRNRVSWNSIIGAKQYEVYRSLSSDPDTAVLHITIPNATIYDDLDVIQNTPYYYWVKAKNLYTTSAFSVSNWGFCGMITPSDVTASDGIYSDRIRVNWNTSGALATYQVWRNTSEHQPSSALIGTTPDLLYDDASAVPGIQYYYWIRATNTYGTTLFSLPDSGFVGITPPSSFSASGGTLTGSVHLAWSAAQGATGYELWRSTTTNTATLLATTTDLNYSDTATPHGVIFYYWLRATNAITKSDLSASESGFSGVPFPSGVNASDNLYTNMVLVSWEAVPTALDYEVWSGKTPNPAASAKIGETAALSFSDTNCDVDTIYYYWVKARVGSVASQVSAYDTGRRKSTTPPAMPPAWVDASDGTYTNLIRIIWPAAHETSEYEVWRNTVNVTDSATLIATTPEHSCDDTTVVAGMTYFYWLRSRNSSGVSAFSLPDSGYAAAADPTGQANLALTDLVFLPNIVACGQHPGAISMRIENLGPDKLAAPDTRVTVDFFVTTNIPFSSLQARWIGDYSTDLFLDADHTTTLVLPRTDVEVLTMPHDLTGSFYVVARIRHSYPSGLEDPDMSNNTTEKQSLITIPTEGGGIYQVRNDFDFDGSSDFALYHQASGAWYILGANGNILAWHLLWGGPGYIPVSGDYDGDRKADPAVYCNGFWYIANIQGTPIAYEVPWGDAAFTPVPGDFDGDGRSDLAVYLESAGTWYITSLQHGVIAFGDPWGGPGLSPVPGDYAGNGRTDLSVYDDAGFWYVQAMPTRKTLLWQKNWGFYNMLPVPGDYDGDGYADMAVYKNGLWYIRSLQGELLLWADSWGGPGFIPVPGDFNGDGKADLAVYHPLTGAWYIKTTDNDILTWNLIWGGLGYMPIDAVRY